MQFITQHVAFSHKDRLPHEEGYMTYRRRYVDCSRGAYFFRAIPIITLDTHLVYHVFCDLLYFPKERYLMTDRENQGGKILDMLARSPTAQFIKGSLKLILQLIIGGCIMAVFVLISWGCEKLAIRFTPESPVSAFACRIIGACIVSAGAVIIAVFIYASARNFIKSVIKGPPQKTPGQEAADERGDE